MLKNLLSFIEKSAKRIFGPVANKEEYAIDELLTVFDNERREKDEKAISALEESRRTKRDFFSKALQGGIASVYLDPRLVDVKVPENFKGQDVLILNYSYRYHVADFDFDDEKIVASLSFNGVPRQTTVPWDAVIGIGNQSEGVFYSFVTDLPVAMKNEEKKSVQKVENHDPIFDPVSHEKALERRKAFQVIKGGKV